MTVARPLPAVEHATPRELADRLAHGGAPDTELRRERLLAGQPVSEGPDAGAHAVEQELGRLVREGAPVQRGHGTSQVV